MRAIRGVIFDKDGTLFDFQATWAGWTEALVSDLAGGVEDRADRLAAALGFDRRTARFAPDSPVISRTPDDIAEALLPELPGASPTALVARMNALAAEAEQVPAVPLAAVLGQLRDQGLALGLVTNDGAVPAAAHLDRAGILPLFDFVAGYDSGHGAKPAPGPLLAFARALDLRPEAVVMVGDSRHDLTAGRAAGMRTVGVLTGLAAEADLAPLADAVLPDIGHLAGWLEGAGG